MKIHRLIQMRSYAQSIRTGAIILLISVAVTGCSIKMTRLGNIDKTDKSITIPAGSDNFMTTLKVCLTNEGWRIENFAGAEITAKTGSKDLKYDTFNTRYVMAGRYELHSDEYIPRLSTANFSIIDVKSRNEVALFKTSGEVTLSSFCEKLAPQLKELEL